MKKKIIAAIAAFLLAAILLFAAGALVMPKYVENPEGRLVGEYYSQAGENDVIFLGDCEVYESFVPAVLWEKYGISSYVRGSSQQLIWQSYYLLEEMMRTETPKAVVFNVLALKYGDPQNPLGTVFLALALPDKPDKPYRGYGIHGTADNNTVGRSLSNGCIRMHNDDVTMLFYLLPSGTPVEIIE